MSNLLAAYFTCMQSDFTPITKPITRIQIAHRKNSLQVFPKYTKPSFKELKINTLWTPTASQLQSSVCSKRGSPLHSMLTITGAMPTQFSNIRLESSISRRSISLQRAANKNHIMSSYPRKIMHLMHNPCDWKYVCLLYTSPSPRDS